MEKRITIAQISVETRELQLNTKQIVSIMESAAERGSELIIFPEMVLSGYTVNDNDFTQDFKDEITASINEIKSVSKALNIDVVMCYPEVIASGNYIVSSYINNGEIKSTHRKVYLADYWHCTDHHYFTPGNQIEVIPTRFGKIALLLCEDGWHLTTSIIAAQKGAEIIIASAATSLHGEDAVTELQNTWETVSKAVSLTQSCYFVYCNRAGIEEDKRYWGGSHIANPKGDIIKRFPTFSAEVDDVIIDQQIVLERRTQLPLVDKEKNEFNALQFQEIYDTNK